MPPACRRYHSFRVDARRPAQVFRALLFIAVMPLTKSSDAFHVISSPLLCHTLLFLSELFF